MDRDVAEDLAQGRRFYLDVELMDPEEPATSALIGRLLSGRCHGELKPMGYQSPSPAFDAPYRFHGTFRALLEVATIYVETQQNPDGWDYLQIVDLETGKVIDLAETLPIDMPNQQFTAQVSHVELISPIELTDELSEQIQGDVRGQVEAALAEIRTRVEENYRALGVRLSY